MIVCVLSELQRSEYQDELREIARLDGNLVFSDSVESALARIGVDRPTVVIVSFHIGAVERYEFLAMLSGADTPYDGPVVVLPPKAGGLPTVVYTHERPVQGGPAEELVKIVDLIDFVASIVRPHETVAAKKPAEAGIVLAPGDRISSNPRENRSPSNFAKDALPESRPSKRLKTGFSALLRSPTEPPEPPPRLPSSLRPVVVSAQPSTTPGPSTGEGAALTQGLSHNRESVAPPSSRGLPEERARDLLPANTRGMRSARDSRISTRSRSGWRGRATPIAAGGIVAIGLLVAVAGYAKFPRSERHASVASGSVVALAPARTIISVAGTTADSSSAPSEALPDPPAPPTARAVPPAAASASAMDPSSAAIPAASQESVSGGAGEPVFTRVLPLAFERTSVWPVLTNMKVLSEIVAELKGQPDAMIELIGHTSNDGNRKPDVDNLISRVRAEAAKAVLVNLGIQPDRIRIGRAEPDDMLAPNDTERNRRRNRRVVIKMYSAAPAHDE